MSLSSALRGTCQFMHSNLFVTLPEPTASFADQTIIVTGANTGLGFESSKHLVRLGISKLITGVRTMEKGEAARPWQADMESSESVKSFAARANTQLPRLDGLLANAGVWPTTFGAVEGDEQTIKVNVVGTFLLALVLLPKLRESAERNNTKARIVIPNSALHYMADTKDLEVEGSIFAHLSDPKKAKMGNRYMLSKAMVLYLVREFAERTSSKETNPQDPRIIIDTPSPSYCQSGLLRSQPSLGQRLGDKYLARSTEEGSRALVDGLSKGPGANGQYLSDCHVEKPSSLVTNARGRAIQRRLFEELLEKLEKVSPGISSRV